MNITLLASHFKGADFKHCSDCALARAIQGIYPNSVVREGVHSAVVDFQHVLHHEEYNKEMFEIDAEMAKEFDYSDQIKIREVEVYDNQRTMAVSEYSGAYSYESVL